MQNMLGGATSVLSGQLACSSNCIIHLSALVCLSVSVMPSLMGNAGGGGDNFLTQSSNGRSLLRYKSSLNGKRCRVFLVVHIALIAFGSRIHRSHMGRIDYAKHCAALRAGEPILLAQGANAGLVRHDSFHERKRAPPQEGERLKKIPQRFEVIHENGISKKKHFGRTLQQNSEMVLRYGHNILGTIFCNMNHFFLS